MENNKAAQQAETVDGIPIKYELLPEQFRAGAERWIEHGIHPGSFLQAVLENNLRQAVFHADDNEHIAAVCFWFRFQSPHGCHGSPETAVRWHEARRSQAA